VGKKEIKLNPGYDPDKYRDELCELSFKNQGTMSYREFMMLRNEMVRRSPLFKKYENEDEALKPNGKKED